MKFNELAWGAFVFSNLTSSTYSSPYQNLIADTAFMQRLPIDPQMEDFQRLREFLVNYGVHYARKDLAEQYLRVWPQLKPHVQQLIHEDLMTCQLGKEEVGSLIAQAYGCLSYPSVWGGDTVASKVLHFFNLNLFMMWDIPIKTHFGKSYGPCGYVDFLQEMQGVANEITADFRQLSLPGAPDEYLSKMLGYSYTRPLTKFIDDYNWVTITKHWPTRPPEWLMALLLNSG